MTREVTLRLRQRLWTVVAVAAHNTVGAATTDEKVISFMSVFPYTTLGLIDSHFNFDLGAEGALTSFLTV